jgi:4-hydroxy-4-methyl-2-oxoglutarate aldolase
VDLDDHSRDLTPTANDKWVSEALVQAGVSTLHEASGRHGLLAGLRLMVGEPFAGQAVTVSIPAGDNQGIHLAFKEAFAGCVVCVASAGRGLYGVTGDVLQEMARDRGIAALVLEDGIRDVAELKHPPAVAALGVTSRGTIKRRVRSMGDPVGIGGTLVCPGDWVVGDRDGVCVIPKDGLAVTLEEAVARNEREARLRQQIREEVKLAKERRF